MNDNPFHDQESSLEGSIKRFEGPVCPLPLSHHDRIVAGHGSGGRMTNELIEHIFKPNFDNPFLQQGNDSAVINLTNPGRIAVSTDAHVVSPLFFPGGDIGRLAVCGTVNDVSALGAQPLYLTASFILEEGLAVETLQKLATSMAEAAREAGVCIVAGDTKVVENGKADGIFITTSGIGVIPEGIKVGGELARPGDVVLVSGTLGEHGIAVLEGRGHLGFQTDILSDTAPLNHMVAALLKAAPGTHVLRDPTRGGLATTLNEIAVQSKVGILIEEQAVPVLPQVRAACEMLGFDPLYIANEGKMIAIVPPEQAAAALEALQKSPYGSRAARIGSVQSGPQGRVLLHTLIGGTRLLDVLAGEMLPRIC